MPEGSFASLPDRDRARLHHPISAQSSLLMDDELAPNGKPSVFFKPQPQRHGRPGCCHGGQPNSDERRA
jgi:hypothetical protein